MHDTAPPFFLLCGGGARACAWRSTAHFFFSTLTAKLVSVMPPSKGALWEFFYRGEKKNSSHYHAFCLGCLKKHQPNEVPISIDEDGSEVLPLDDAWFKEGESHFIYI